MVENLVVVGGVAAGLSAASAAKRLKKDAMNAVVFEKSGYISYGACSEPYFVSGLVPEPEDLIEVTPEEFEQKRSIPIHRMHEVVAIDYKNGYVTIDDLVGHKSFKEPFDYLMISTGALGKGLGIDGEQLMGVHTLRTVEDAIAVRKSALDSNDIVICGGGYIGLEMAEAFVAMGKRVTILKKTSQMLLNFDPEMSTLVEEEVRSKGVTIVTGVDILSIEGSERVEKKERSISTNSQDTEMTARRRCPAGHPAQTIFRLYRKPRAHVNRKPEGDRSESAGFFVLGRHRWGGCFDGILALEVAEIRTGRGFNPHIV